MQLTSDPANLFTTEKLRHGHAFNWELASLLGSGGKRNLFEDRAFLETPPYIRPPTGYELFERERERER